MEKQLARWVYFEDGNKFYCKSCIEKRLEEINDKKEFSEDINYEGGDKCGYFEDYAFVDCEVFCDKCKTPLYSQIDY